MIQEDEEIAETMKKAQSRKPIVVREIGASVLAGGNPITGQEVDAVGPIFYGDVEQSIGSGGEITNE